MKKKNLVKVLATVACAATLCGVGAWSVQASADATLGGVDVSSFRMSYGASVRFKASDGKNGIRFTATMTEDAYNGLEALQTSDSIKVDYGMLIVPADMTALVNDPQSAFGSDYTFVDCDETSDTCTCGKTHLATVTYETLSVGLVDDKATVETANLRGSLVDVKSGNLTRAFVGMGYIEYTTGNTTTRYFAKHALDEAGTAGSEDVDNNTRSMTHVSQLAVEDGEDDTSNTLYYTYIKPIEENGKKYQYTINHYLPTGTGNAYELAETETKYATLNTSVAAANIAKSTLENKAEYKEYATYSFDSTLGAVNSTVYPNGRTVLNCYYKAVDTTVWSATNDSDVTLWVKNGNALQEMPADEATMADATRYYKTGVSYTDANGETRENVLKYVENKGDFQYGVGQLWVSFAEDKLQQLKDSNWDYLTFKMCMVPTTAATGAVSATSMAMYSGASAKLGEIPTNEWVEFIVPKALLNSNGSVFVGRSEALKADVDFDYKMSTGTTSVCAAGTNTVLFYSNTVKNNAVNLGEYSCTYYFDEISYGVDCTAPVIQSVSSPIDGQAYTPEVVVEDDIVGTLGTEKSNAIYSTELYEVDVTSGAREKLTATDGAYTLTKSADKKYILAVSATDQAVTDIVGNELYEEIELTVKSANELLLVTNKYDVNGVKANTWALDSVSDKLTPTISYLDSHTAGSETETSVIKYETRNLKTQNIGAGFYLNLDAETATTVANAYLDAKDDDTKTFTLTFRICIEVDDGKESWIFTNGNTFGETQSCGVWVDHVLTEEHFLETYSDGTKIRSGWTDVDSIVNRLTGEVYMFYLNSSSFSGSNGSAAEQKVTIYVKSISYAVTDVQA